jgi:uncharacterized protein YjbI with pentapeptide repeats
MRYSRPEIELRPALAAAVALRGRRGRLPALLLGVLMAATVAFDAAADCSDLPAPEVRWRRCIFDGLDLSNADLSGSEIRDSSLTRADLSGADLAGSDLARSKFVSTRLKGADLSDTDLTMVDFTNADLTGAILKGALFRRTKLYNADLREADLTGARLEQADFLHADLTGARWIDGKTICAQGSSGRCVPSGKGREASLLDR